MNELNRQHLQGSNLVFVPAVPEDHLDMLLEFMYKGEINIDSDKLDSLLNSARILQVKGLMQSPSVDIRAHDDTPPQQLRTLDEDKGSLGREPFTLPSPVLTAALTTRMPPISASSYHTPLDSQDQSTNSNKRRKRARKASGSSENGENPEVSPDNLSRGGSLIPPAPITTSIDSLFAEPNLRRNISSLPVNFPEQPVPFAPYNPKIDPSLFYRSLYQFDKNAEKEALTNAFTQMSGHAPTCSTPIPMSLSSTVAAAALQQSIGLRNALRTSIAQSNAFPDYKAPSFIPPQNYKEPVSRSESPIEVDNEPPQDLSISKNDSDKNEDSEKDGQSTETTLPKKTENSLSPENADRNEKTPTPNDPTSSNSDQDLSSPNNASSNYGKAEDTETNHMSDTNHISDDEEECAAIIKNDRVETIDPQPGPSNVNINHTEANNGNVFISLMCLNNNNALTSMT